MLCTPSLLGRVLQKYSRSQVSKAHFMKVGVWQLIPRAWPGRDVLLQVSKMQELVHAQAFQKQNTANCTYTASSQPTSSSGMCKWHSLQFSLWASGKSVQRKKKKTREETSFLTPASKLRGCRERMQPNPLGYKKVPRDRCASVKLCVHAMYATSKYIL